MKAVIVIGAVAFGLATTVVQLLLVEPMARSGSDPAHFQDTQLLSDLAPDEDQNTPRCRGQKVCRNRRQLS